MMKTMTCKQLGGACERAHAGTDANEIIQAQDRHLREEVASGSSEHEAAFRDMRRRWRLPLSGMKWYRQVAHDFAALASDDGSR